MTTFIGQTGPDTFLGSTGDIDTVDYSASTDAVSIDLGTSTAQIVSVSQDVDTFISIEAIIGSQFGDVLIGGLGQAFFYGGSGNDSIFGGTSGGASYGSFGSDSFFGRSGADMFFGGRDNDVLIGSGGNDSLYAGYDNDTLFGAPAMTIFMAIWEMTFWLAAAATTRSEPAPAKTSSILAVQQRPFRLICVSLGHNS